MNRGSKLSCVFFGVCVLTLTLSAVVTGEVAVVLGGAEDGDDPRVVEQRARRGLSLLALRGVVALDQLQAPALDAAAAVHLIGGEADGVEHAATELLVGARERENDADADGPRVLPELEAGGDSDDEHRDRENPEASDRAPLGE